MWGTGTPSTQPFPEIARKTFVAWEILRIPYNLILLAVVFTALGSSFTAVVFSSRLLQLIAYAGIANGCYFAGPFFETYLAWLGIRPRLLRPLLFILGTFLASLLALVLCITSLAPSEI